MKRRLIVGLLAVGVPALALGEPGQSRFEFSQVEMAVSIRIVLYSANPDAATAAAKEAFSRIHDLNSALSDYDSQSELCRLCDTAGEGKPVPVSLDLWKVLEHAQHVSEISEGAFDVTVGPAVRLWRRARRQKELPKPEKLQAARRLIGYKQLRLDPQHHTAELLTKGMLLDLGGIAKGYAMDEAMAVLTRRGVTRALVEAGGDMRMSEPPPGQKGWRVGIPPLDDPRGTPVAYLELSQIAVSTSGDLIQFVEIGGKRYSHVVDPRTGEALTDHCRVMVVGPRCMATDAISKAVGILGAEKGMKLIDNEPSLAAMLMRAPNGAVERTESKRWKELPLVRLKAGS